MKLTLNISNKFNLFATQLKMQNQLKKADNIKKQVFNAY